MTLPSRGGVTRRTSLVVSGRALLALLAALPSLRCAGTAAEPSTNADDPDSGGTADHDHDTGDSTATTLDWLGFLAALERLAQGQFEAGWDEEAYVEQVVALMAALDLGDPTVESFYADYTDRYRDFPEITAVHDGGFFEVSILQFAAGERIDLHNHPRMTGVILCVSGDITIENYDLLDRTSPAGNLLLEQRETARLLPGDFGTLTSDRGNIHALTAATFTELLDVFTPPYDDERLQDYRWYTRGADPIEGDSIYEAWEA